MPSPEPGPSQARRADSQKLAQSMSKSDLQRLVNDVLHYILKVDSKKYSIKRQDIVKQVLKEHSKAYDLVMTDVTKKLNDIFGIKIIEVEGKKGQYIMSNTLKINEENSHVQLSMAEYEKQGLLTIILALIFMNGNVATEEVMNNFLMDLGVLPQENDGDKKTLQDFVRMLYLEKNRIETSDPAAYEYRWGPRAHMEISKTDILQMVCKIYGDMKPEQWTQQYQEITEERRRREEEGVPVE